MRKLLLFVLLFPLMVRAQEEEDPKFVIKGYLKDMITFNFPAKDSTLIDNLIHHRLNLAYYPNDQFTAKLEFRNRVFTGDLVRLFPNYASLIDVNND